MITCTTRVYTLYFCAINVDTRLFQPIERCDKVPQAFVTTSMLRARRFCSCMMYVAILLQNYILLKVVSQLLMSSNSHSV